MRKGYDSTAATVAEWLAIVPEADPDVIGSYGNGRFANTTAAELAFPGSTHIQYDVNGSLPQMDILDVEKFDATNDTAPGWAKKYGGSLPAPALYTSASNVAALVTVMLKAGFKRDHFLIQSAHFTNVPHVCGPTSCGFPQADATQYADHGKKLQNTDLSLFEEHFFKAPIPPHNPHYELFATGRLPSKWGLLDERKTVEQYDGARKHPLVYAAYLRLSLRPKLAALADDVYTVAHKSTPPSWGTRNRGWRYHQLRIRALGNRLV